MTSNKTPQAFLQGISDLDDMFFGSDYQTVIDGFKLKEVEFKGMSMREIEQTIERLRHETVRWLPY